MTGMKAEWRFRCGKCGIKKLLKDTGSAIRLGAGNKRVLGWCSNCSRFRCVFLEKVHIPIEKKGSPTTEK